MCECDHLMAGLSEDWHNGVICVKVQASGSTMQRFCYPGPYCPGDMTACSGPPKVTCFDTKPTHKCLRKMQRGKCRRPKVRTKKCRKTCGDCHS